MWLKLNLYDLFNHHIIIIIGNMITWIAYGDILITYSLEVHVQMHLKY